MCKAKENTAGYRQEAQHGSGGEIFMRIRDNAPQFDPFKKLEMYRENEDDPAKNIGIRMVSKIAREMKYQTTLEMNVLTIAR